MRKAETWGLLLRVNMVIDMSLQLILIGLDNALYPVR